MKTALLTLLLLMNFSSLQINAKSTKPFLFIISAHDYGYYLPELVTPMPILNEANIQVDIASPDGKPGKAVAMNRLNQQDRIYFNKIKNRLSPPFSLTQIDPSKYSGVYIVGGSGPMFDLYQQPQVSRIVSELVEQNKIISADCHGPIALAGIKKTNGDFLLKGLRVTAKSNAEEGSWARSRYPFLVEDKLEESGAIYSSGLPGKAHVVVDGMLVTGQNPASAEPLALKLLELLKVQH